MTQEFDTGSISTSSAADCLENLSNFPFSKTMRRRGSERDLVAKLDALITSKSKGGDVSVKSLSILPTTSKNLLPANAFENPKEAPVPEATEKGDAPDSVRDEGRTEHEPVLSKFFPIGDGLHPLTLPIPIPHPKEGRRDSPPSFATFPPISPLDETLSELHPLVKPLLAPPPPPPGNASLPSFSELMDSLQALKDSLERERPLSPVSPRSSISSSNLSTSSRISPKDLSSRVPNLLNNPDAFLQFPRPKESLAEEFNQGPPVFTNPWKNNEIIVFDHSPLEDDLGSDFDSGDTSRSRFSSDSSEESIYPEETASSRDSSDSDGPFGSPHSSFSSHTRSDSGDSMYYTP